MCLAGQSLYADGRERDIGGYIAIKFRGSESACGPCTQRDKCLRTPDKTRTRQVRFFIGKVPGKYAHTERMKQRIDSASTAPKAEPCMRGASPRWSRCTPTCVTTPQDHNKQLNRFTLRGQAKVDGQWKLLALVHNIEKLAHHGYAQ